MNTPKITKTFALAASSLALLAGAAPSASAMGKFVATHPRRDEVNARLATQDVRIHREVKSGDITKAQGAALHQDDHQIRQEERDMASQDGSHITKVDQRALNQQENGVSAAIGH